jgi:uncharacterized protein (TIGR00369 family)
MAGDLAQLAARVEGFPYSRSLGVRIEAVAPDRVRLRVPYKHENSNPGKALHGGVAASVIDIAGTLAAWTGVDDAPGLERATLDLSVNYLAAAIGEDIVAEAEVLRRGKEIVYADVNVGNDAGKRIAKGLVTHRAVAAPSPPPAQERQLAIAPEPPAGLGSDVPAIARAIVAVPFMARLGLAITHMRDGRALVEMPFRAENADGDGAVHEGAIAALLDTAGAMASWSVAGLDLRYKASTVGIHVSYHGAARGEDVVGDARTLRRNNEIFLNTVTVSGRASGEVVATGSVTYRIVVPG